MRPILEELTKTKAGLIKEGKDVGQLDLGNPFGQVLPAAILSLQESAADSNNWRYQPARGIPELQSAITTRLARGRKLAVVIDPTKNVIVTRGSKAGIAHLLYLQGDAIYPNPCYAIHHDGVEIGWHYATPYNCYPGTDTAEEIEKACKAAPNAKLIIVNKPHNPSGAVATLEEFQRIVAIARKYGKRILSDMAYGDLMLNGQQAPSMLEVEGFDEIGVESWSMTKGDNMAGNVGFMIGNEDIAAQLADFQTNYGYGVFKPLQMAAATACLQGAHLVEANCRSYVDRDKCLTQGLTDQGWPGGLTEGAIYKWWPIPEGFHNAEVFCRRLLLEALVAMWPASGFINTPRADDTAPDWTRHVRMSLVESIDRLPEIVSRIGKFIRSNR